MERNLKDLLLKYYNNFDEFGAYDINEYFNSEFGDDYDVFALDSNNSDALEYLNEEFIEIDYEGYNDPNFATKVKSVLKRAIELINN